MSHAEKVLDKWIAKTPKCAPLEDVEQVLEFFSISWRQGGGHTIVVNDRRLNGSNWFKGGNLAIPTVAGRTVKGFYIKTLLNALRWMRVI